MRIHIIGDSTAAPKQLHARPETGWGEKFYLFFNEEVEILNHAFNGKSTRSFIAEKRFEEVMRVIQKGDVLIMQFGHNDSKIEDPLRYADPYDAYPKKLEFMIKETKEKGAFPIVLSSVSRRHFKSKHRVNKKNVIVYPMIAKQVAKREKVVFFDIFKKTRKLYEYFGWDLSRKLFLHIHKAEHKNYPEGIYDDTHFNDLGAMVVASLVAEELYFTKQDHPLKDYILVENLINRIDVKRAINV
ncbi:rhamnogalacturonan acetylesterase [Acholeplasma equirhinis]|uniref:rhamnogalacturonan acetylesterase n=1 Tax=Acholeplasma equirhinis TaxID=555393 RepID=UPI00197A7AB0|nr:rhamnogalacturonan acetylesterase [Acholeplasma equirhinis]MBN3490312.1 rhamnogalacturonan acetylesterase [Acholeplasma equirhinis]